MFFKKCHRDLQFSCSWSWYRKKIELMYNKFRSSPECYRTLILYLHLKHLNFSYLDHLSSLNKMFSLQKQEWDLWDTPMKYTLHEVIKNDAKLVIDLLSPSLSYAYTGYLKMLTMMCIKYKHSRNSHMRRFKVTW